MSLLCTAPSSLGRVAIFPPRTSRGAWKSEHTEALIGCDALIVRPRNAKGIDAVVGWGLKDHTLDGVDFAHKHNLPFWRIEDGFLRSMDLGVQGGLALSMVLDDQSIYYDARRPSRLESSLELDTTELRDKELLARAEAAIEKIVRHELSKYNNSPVHTAPLPDSHGRKRVLVVDQTAGDLSVRCGLGRRGDFEVMLRSAIEENPDAEIIIKTHPDVLNGSKQGYLGRDYIDSRVRVYSEACNPLWLLKQVDKVYVITSQLGFEALLLGKELICFGEPFYAGWGLTDDRQQCTRRTRKRSLNQVFAAAYMLYTRYIDPDTGRACDIETVLTHFVLQRQEFVRNQGKIYCFGFFQHFWKRNYVRAYLRCPGNEIIFVRTAAHAIREGFDQDSKLLTWGQRSKAQVSELSDRFDVPVWRMEDGFLRSVGLGSDRVTPASIVVDRQGIYYDPTQPSELETILQNTHFEDALLTRGAQLRQRLVDSGLSKYNVGDHLRVLNIDPQGRTVVLVAGQVEDDASIQLGCRSINTNLDALKKARATLPDAYIVFKPHPDVLSGNRVGNVPQDLARKYCDHIELDASLAQCLAVADQVHVMTSLVGFEALLRGIEVHCYGQPFYAGWGLTHDEHPVERRTRKLKLNELVAATYIVYPRYLNRHSFRFTSPEAVIDQLEIDRSKGGQEIYLSAFQRRWRKIRNMAKEVIRGS